MTKHNSNHILSNIEESVIPYLGFLPQVWITGIPIPHILHLDPDSSELSYYVKCLSEEILNNNSDKIILELGRPIAKYVQ